MEDKTLNWMHLRHLVPVGWILGVAFGIVACGSQDSSSRRYLVPIINSQGKEEIREVELRSLYSATSLEGSAAYIMIRDGATWDEPDRGILGNTRMRLTRVGNVWAPADPGTALGLATYYLMEKMHNKDLEMGVAHYISWPRRLAVDVPLKGNLESDYVRTVAGRINYFPSYDAIVAYEYQDSRVPMNMDPTVLAHEHTHPYFEKLFMKPFLQALQTHHSEESYNRERLQAAFREQDVLSPVTYAYALIESFNEGFADFGSFVQTKETAFGRWSLSEDFYRIRNMMADSSLDPFQQFMQTFSENNRPSRGPCATLDGREKPRMCLRYTQGTLLARWLRRLSLALGDSPEALYRHILSQLEPIAIQLAQRVGAAAMSARPQAALGFDYFVTEIYLRRPDSEFNRSICSLLSQAIPTRYEENFGRGKCRGMR